MDSQEKDNEEKKLEDNNGFVDLMPLHQCCICFDNNTEEILECGHSFCGECVNSWFAVKNSKMCPLCRYSYPDDESAKNIIENTFKILDDQLVTEYLDKSIQQIFEIFEPFFDLPDFKLMN